MFDCPNETIMHRRPKKTPRTPNYYAPEQPADASSSSFVVVVVWCVQAESRIPRVVVMMSSRYKARRLFVELALVESELLTLEDVSVGAAGLAGARRDDGVEATGLELLLEGAVDLAGGGEALGLLLLDRVGALDLLNGLTLLHLASAAKELAVVGLVPLTERSGINLDDGGLGQGVGADELVVGRVV